MCAEANLMGNFEHLTPVAPLLAVLPHFHAIATNGSTNPLHAFGLIASSKAQSNAPSVPFRSADSEDPESTTYGGGRPISEPWPKLSPPYVAQTSQRSTTDPAFYTYPPPLNTSRDLVVPPSETKQAETSPESQIALHQSDTPIWDESFPHPHRIGHAESYTRADDSSWGGSYSSPRRAHSSDWRPVPLEQYEGYPLPSLCTASRVLAEPSSSRISFIPYIAEPEGLSARPYDHQDSVATDQSHEQPYLQPATPHCLPGFSSPDDFVSPLLDSVLLDVPGLPTTVDGSSSEAGQGDIADEGSPKRSARKGKRKASNLLEEDRPLRRLKKKTEIACDFCRGRKLGCSGDRPKCKACIKRKGECVYASAPRRRGPGKAPRGSRKVAKDQQPFPSSDFTFRVPVPPPIQQPSVDSFGPPPANVEPSRDRERRASNVDRIFLTSFPWTGDIT
ncbi:hypothetical protein EI94DRAFT_1697602 [Lactarius quietus]|nr:hypothetical protein EI94DRAFT_1697602 [Lactarius quietus]